MINKIFKSAAIKSYINMVKKTIKRKKNKIGYDTVTISEQGLILSKIYNSDCQFNKQKIMKLKKMIKEGSYQIDIESIAEKMME